MGQRPRDNDDSADAFAVPGGGTSDREYSVGQRLASVEQSLIYIEGTTSDTKQKVEGLLIEVASAKGSLRVIKWVLGIVGGVGLIFLGFIAVVAEMWLKNHMGWK